MKDYEYLWNEELRDHLLLETKSGSVESERFLIFNRKTKTMLIIEDEDLNRAVCRELKSRGCEIVSDPRELGV